MSDHSAIEWTEATWNPVRGCVKVSPGCAHCYAETFAERFRGVKGHPYEQGFDLRLVPHKLLEPWTWKKPRRVFVNSMSDLFQDGVPVEYIDRVFATMALAPQHTFQVLTKRAERMRAYFTEPWDRRVFEIYRGLFADGLFTMPTGYDEQWALGQSIGAITCGAHERRFLPNVWLGVSVENQRFADERIPLLLQTPAAVRFISAEPLLGSVTIPDVFLKKLNWGDGSKNWPDGGGVLDWVIVGGESGAGARECNVRWVRSIVEQCHNAGVACFVKQLGTNTRGRNDDGFEGDRDPSSWPMDTRYRELDHGYQGAPVRVFLRKKGGLPIEWPADLRVRQYPTLSQLK